MTLPADDHTHTQWSWDAVDGSMEGSCARAVELGLPSIAFTEHVDHTRWTVPREVMFPAAERNLGDDGRFAPPPFDIEGYLASVERCRERYPSLTILTGAELGEPHLFPEQTRELLASGAFERVLGSLHTLPVDGVPWLVDALSPPTLPDGLTHDEVIRRYLRAVTEMIPDLPGEIQVLAHIDYPLRRAQDPDPTRFEEEFRDALAALAPTGRVLEVNTRVPLATEVVGWWREAGGQAVSFGSDAHRPDAVADSFAEAAAMVGSHGFRPDRHPHGFWHL
jgi:histidinol-phosphatase (PHP family)